MKSHAARGADSGAGYSGVNLPFGVSNALHFMQGTGDTTTAE